MAQKPLPSLAAPLLCHFCFQHFAAQFSEHQKAAYTRYVLCAAISIPFFAHILLSRIFLAYCMSSHCKFCTNAQKKCVFVHFLRYRICAFVFCDSFSIFTRFPYNFVVTVLQHIQIRTNFLNLCKIFPQSLLDTGLSYFSIMHKSFFLSSYVLT